MKIIYWPVQCKCGHLFLEKYQFNEPTEEGKIGFCWCGFCRTKEMVVEFRGLPKGNVMECRVCNQLVKESECTFTGLHRDCYGRVYFPNGREFLGSLKKVDRKERASDECC